MATCIFTVVTLIMASHLLYADLIAIFIRLWQGNSTPNSVVFSECTHLIPFNPCPWLLEFIYIPDLLHSLHIEPTWLNTRLVAFTSLTSICLVHGTLLKQGLRLQNTLGALKLLVLALIPVSGFLYLAGVKGIQVGDEYEKPNNFTWDSFWEGSGTGPSAFVNGLYNVIWYELSVSGFYVCIFNYWWLSNLNKGLSLDTRALMLYFRRFAILYEPSDWRLLSPWSLLRRYTFSLTFHITLSFPRQTY